MLVELAVENYAVIESARVRFGAGLNLLTGETGSGKSIVVDALGLLLGGRASADAIRAGADRARVSGIFEVALSPELIALLDETGIELEDGELLVEREIQSSGKSRAFVGNRPATAALLKRLAPHLADIHGQHDQHDLFAPTLQRAMLDEFADAASLLDEVRRLHAQWREASAELEDLDRTAQEKLRLTDLWTFQKNEIEAVNPQSGEDDQLAAERRVLRNVVRLTELAGAAYEGLYENPDSISSGLSSITKSIDELAEIDEAAREIAVALQPASIAIEEATHALRTYLSNLEADPARLDEVESRLAAIEKLKRKYGGTVEEILAFLDEARRELDAVENSEGRRTELAAKLNTLASGYLEQARKLSAARSTAAKKLARQTEQELSALAMDKSRVAIEVHAAQDPASWAEHGIDRIEFLIAPNQGEQPKPIAKIASGGELSRVALALKTCTAAASPNSKRRKDESTTPRTTPRTMVFDEVDAGVGGGAAEAVGRRLKRLSAANQLLCVTHLPQIAGFADHHFYVEKSARAGRTTATVVALNGQDRAKEVGRMLSGERVTAEAMKHAKQLIKMAGE